MKNLYLLLIIMFLSGCSNKDDVKPDMTEFLVGSYILESYNTMGELRKLLWAVEKESDNTVKMHMTSIYTPFKGTPSVFSDTTISGIKISNVSEIEFSYTNKYNYSVDVLGTIYQGHLYVKSEYLKLEVNYYGTEFKFKKQ
ncbi:hypothetical protein [Dyadobacter sp. CY323]|uniref:hypothetical protein n=1 Tax=Dyadobacter sp. CY323 TaxID=2907302 RepID=UPI001F210CD5|nr:hypothetical protein [Dyadobacter sp. CY323]MCE6989290.1 hypothetical protein [Dyadobacter sp. CY323]